MPFAFAIPLFNGPKSLSQGGFAQIDLLFFALIVSAVSLIAKLPLHAAASGDPRSAELFLSGDDELTDRNTKSGDVRTGSELIAVTSPSPSPQNRIAAREINSLYLFASNFFVTAHQIDFRRQKSPGEYRIGDFFPGSIQVREIEFLWKQAGGCCLPTGIDFQINRRRVTTVTPYGVDSDNRAACGILIKALQTAQIYKRALGNSAISLLLSRNIGLRFHDLGLPAINADLLETYPYQGRSQKSCNPMTRFEVPESLRPPLAIGWFCIAMCLWFLLARYGHERRRPYAIVGAFFTLIAAYAGMGFILLHDSSCMVLP
jgi:hypothetical protein